MKKEANYFEDAFGYNVRVGDRIIYYSGSSGALKIGFVKSIKNEQQKRSYAPYIFTLWKITLESGSVIQNPNITMKDNG